MSTFSPRFLQWKQLYTRSLQKLRERRTQFKTSSHIPLEPLYVREHLAQTTDQDNFAGEFPFTRGIQPSMYRSRFWTMRQYAGFGDAKESNMRYHQLLKQGQTGLSIAFDLPTQMGYDSDSVRAQGEVGKVGVAIDTLEDMQTLLKDLPLDKISTSMTINSTASILLCMYMAVAEQAGVARIKLSGTVQNDILKEYMARGTYIFPPVSSMRLITDMFEFCAQEMPLWNTISISGYHIREAGATAVQEVAFTLANAIAYVEAALKKGLLVDDFAPRLSFFFNVHNQFLEEIAKFRAARRLWAEIMRERFFAQDSKSMMLRFHAQTAGSTLTAQQPDNNIVRVGIQALSAVLGGCQSLHTNSKDEALGLPTIESAQIALRTQQIIAHETGVSDVVDPLGGSYCIESITEDIYKRAKQQIEHIDKLGGAVAALLSGYQNQEIEEAAYQTQLEFESKQQLVVGMNEFVQSSSIQTPVMKIALDTEVQQKKRLAQVKNERSQTQFKQALEQVRTTAVSDGNLMPAILQAVRAYASLGEISDVLRSVFGEYTHH